jgi:pantoate--beta-alanine ligase
VLVQAAVGASLPPLDPRDALYGRGAADQRGDRLDARGEDQRHDDASADDQRAQHGQGDDDPGRPAAGDSPSTHGRMMRSRLTVPGRAGTLRAMDLVHDPEALVELAAAALVPTMGALHEGHAALIRRAAETSRPVVVSVFVNPTQFGPGEDFERYPRTLDEDVETAAANGAHVVFAPDVEAVYPDGPRGATDLPAVATEPGLEDAHRPDHFAGVCEVVARLFDLVRPRVAVFGEKDYQQLLVIRAMVAGAVERWPDLEIIGHPTVREPDGLAQSSRNAYLSPAQRKRALGLSRALCAAAGEQGPADAESAMATVLEAHELDVDYAVVRDAETLMAVSDASIATRALIAARIGEVRLIDNA